MASRRRLGRQFGWLWAAYAVSAYGSGLGFGALPLIAVLALHAGAAQVSALSAVGPAVGALLAAPLAPWVEFRRKRPVMVAMDLTRFAAMATIPVTYALGRLSYVQLLVTSAVVAASKIAFNAASGAYLKALVPADDLLVANARFESTNWTTLVVGPPLGGAHGCWISHSVTVLRPCRDDQSPEGSVLTPPPLADAEAQKALTLPDGGRSSLYWVTRDT